MARRLFDLSSVWLMDFPDTLRLWSGLLSKHNQRILSSRKGVLRSKTINGKIKSQ